jgi:hypothetical protein
MTTRDLTQLHQELAALDEQPGVGRQRLDHDRGDLLAVALEQALARSFVVQREDVGQRGDRGGTPAESGVPRVARPEPASPAGRRSGRGSSPRT